MHPLVNRPAVLWIALVAVIATAGCRGSHPFASMVQVSQDPGLEHTDIEPPRQRLATTRRRMQNDQDSHSAAVSDRAASETTDSEVNETRSARRQSASKRSLSSLPDHGPPNRSAKSESDAPREPELPPESDELMAAFRDYPPEVQREALRRLVATTARTAERTEQPRAVDDELAARLNHLPQLPSGGNKPPGQPPQRLAAGRDRETVTASLTDTQAAGAAREPVQTSLTDLETTELSAADSQIAQATTGKQTETEPPVQPAMAAAKPSEPPAVAQASVQQELESSEVSPKPESLEPSAAQDPPAEHLTSDELFGVLLQQLSRAPEGESEAARASRLIKLRHLMVLSGDPDSAVEQIDGMSEAQQEFLRHQLLGLWTMIDPQGHPVPSRRFSTAMPQIRRATQFAAAATDSLEVRSLAFCTEIESYGQIKKFDSNRFESGQQVILYCEIENFTAQHTEAGYETHLQGSYDLFNDRDEKVASQLLPADEQISTNYLRDYFIAYQMYLPEKLSKGKYRLQLTMEDVNGKKYGQADIALQIKP